MKKTLCLIIVSMCIILTVCSNAASIGVIGGADGPTAVLVSKEVKLRQRLWLIWNIPMLKNL